MSAAADRIREAVAFAVSILDEAGLTTANISVTPGLSSVSVQIPGYQREHLAVTEVDQLADTLGLAPDDGEGSNYAREGNVALPSGDTWLIRVYCGRPDDDGAEVTR